MKNDNQKEEVDNLKYKISEEGLDYTFQSYSEWEEIKDEKFHELRKNYLDAARELTEYIDTLKGSEDIEEEEE